MKWMMLDAYAVLGWMQQETGCQVVHGLLISPPWRIIYKTDEHKVWVLAAIDGRRNVEDVCLTGSFSSPEYCQ